MRFPFTTANYSLAHRITNVLSFYIFCTYACWGQATAFQQLDARDGLSQNTVLSIIQDARGFMWFSTPEGLNRYDSRSFRTYENNPADPHSISSNYITASLHDSRQTLWFGTANGLNKYDPNTDSFQQFFHHSTDTSSLTHDQIRCIYEDSRGRIWIGTTNGLNQLIDPLTNRFKRYFLSGPATQNMINSICEDREGNLWLATNNGLIRTRFNQDKIGYTIFTHDRNNPTSLSNNLVTSIAIDQQNNLWIGTGGGDLDRYDPFSASFNHLRKAASTGFPPTQNDINCIHADKDGNLWVGTIQGIIKIETSSMKFTHYQNDPDNSQSLGDNNVYSLFRDKQGSVWAGTYYAGVNVLHPNNTPFYVLKANRSAKSLSNKVVNHIAEDLKHNLWIGVDGEGLDYLNRQNGSITHYVAGPDPKKNLPSNKIRAIYVDRNGYTWVGMRQGGLSRMDPAHQQWTTYHYSSDKISDNVIALLEDSQQRFWLISGLISDTKLTLFNKQKGSFELYKTKKGKISSVDSSVTVNAATVILEDKHKNIWFGGKGGMYLLKYKSTELDWLPFEKNIRNNHSPGHNTVNDIHEDIYGRLWVSTFYDGLKRFDAAHNKFIDYRQADGVPQYAVQSDKTGNLWLSTSYGLVRFDPKTKRSQYYTHSDGIPGSEFENRASYRGADGQLYFGSNDGLLYFDPSKIKTNKQIPTVVFTGLELANKPVKVGDESNLLLKEIGLMDKLTFSYQQNFFTITFAVLNYIKSEKNQFAYKLEGIDQEWHYSKTPSITYNSLPSGQYNLLVKGANNDGIWNPKPTQMQIVILPPLWKTWWAYTLYFLTFSAVLYFILRFFWLKNTFNREQELHQAKLDFFTNISHEIRTHLTLIMGPIDVLLRAKKDDTDIQNQLAYAKNSSDSLLNLVNELMDFRKAESRQINLHVSQNDIILFIKNITASFQHLSDKRHIKFSFVTDKDKIQLWFDEEQLGKVIYNLLSNAYKFISTGDEIQVLIEEDIQYVKIKISDNGKGISADNVKKLFTNYFQVYDYESQNTGYGIGLALSRTITELHHGTLSVESREAQPEKNGFTCFTITLRKGHYHFNKEQLIATSTPVKLPTFREDTPVSPSTTAPASNKVYTILLVEDNTDLRSFLKNVLSHQYNIIEAGNGQAGWKIAISQIPDMVISDIMMAEMDGLELCRRLKTDERTNHIPVILLTAKAVHNHQVEGLATGADGYITKPVNVKILELNIRNLLNARELMRQRYSQQITLEPQNIIINKVDQDFIHKIIQITEEYMGEPEFGVELLTTKVGMSTPVLYKKLKAITNMSVNDFTKSIRMKKAAQLLQQGHLNVNEVATMVGFDDRRYFSREFKKMLGQKPSEYARGGSSLN